LAAARSRWRPPQRYLRTLRGLHAFGPVGLLVSAGGWLHGAAVDRPTERGTSTFRELTSARNALANAWLRRSRPARAWASCVATIAGCSRRWRPPPTVRGADVAAQHRLRRTRSCVTCACANEVELLVHDEEFTAVVREYAPPLGRVLPWTDSAGADARRGDRGADPARPPRPETQQRLVLLTSGTREPPRARHGIWAGRWIAPGGS